MKNKLLMKLADNEVKVEISKICNNQISLILTVKDALYFSESINTILGENYPNDLQHTNLKSLSEKINNACNPKANTKKSSIHKALQTNHKLTALCYTSQRYIGKNSNYSFYDSEVTCQKCIIRMDNSDPQVSKEGRYKHLRTDDKFVDVKVKLQDILFRSKTGKFTRQDENQFAEECFYRWPKEYGELQDGEVLTMSIRTVNPFYR